MSASPSVKSTASAATVLDLADHSVEASVTAGGVSDAFGRSLIEGRPPCGDHTQITKVRSVVRGLRAGDTLHSTDIERIWLLPLGADPGAVPFDVFGELVATLERGKGRRAQPLTEERPSNQCGAGRDEEEQAVMAVRLDLGAEGAVMAKKQVSDVRGIAKEERQRQRRAKREAKLAKRREAREQGEQPEHEREGNQPTGDGKHPR
jgi:hypothetical protein